MRRLIMISAISLTAVVFCAPVAAHHSTAMFDVGKTQTLNGTVKVFEWTNPHAWLWIVIPQAGGKTLDAGIEFPALTMLKRSGMERTAFKPGDKINVTVNPMRDGKSGGLFVQAIVNGKLIKVT